MGNQMLTEQDYDVSERHVSHQSSVTSNRDIPSQRDSHRSHSQGQRSNRHIKSRVRLVPLSGSPKAGFSSSLPSMPLTRNSPDQSEQNRTVYHLSPGQSCTADELTEEEQVRMAQRIGLIQHLPRNTWDETQLSNKKVRECCICMIDFEPDEPIRYLPCMHYYHLDCIDDWLMRSFTCPTCMEPVDAALLSTYDSQNLETLG